MQQAEYRGILNDQKLAAVNSMGPLIKLNNPIAGSVRSSGGAYSNVVTQGVPSHMSQHYSSEFVSGR